MTDYSRKTKKELIEELEKLKNRLNKTEIKNSSKDDIDKAIYKISSNLLVNNKINFQEVVNELGKNSPFQRIFIFEYEEKSDNIKIKYEWKEEGLKSFLKVFSNFSLENFPWFKSKIKKGKVIYFTDSKDLPESASNEKEIFVRNEGKSYLAVPIYNSGKLFGILGGSTVKGNRVDNIDKYFSSFQHVASILSAFLTNQKLTEEVKDKENLLSHLLDRIPVGIFLIREGKFLFANKHGLDILGYTFEEIKDQNIFDLVVDEMREMVINNHKKRLAKKEVTDKYEIKIKNKSGDVKWISLKPELFNYKGLDCVLTTVIDIHDKKIAEIKLSKSEERFRGLYENSSIGIYRTTPAGKIILCNPTLLNMLGFESSEELDKLNLNKQGYYKAQRAEFLEFVKDKEVYYGLEQIWKKKDGKEIFIRESGRVVRDEKGKIQYFEGIVEDITEAKKAAYKLAKESQRYKALFDISPTGIVIEDEKGFILDINKRQSEICGYSKEELVGKHISILAAEKNIDFINQNIERIISGSNLHSTVEAKKKDGSIIFVELHETRIPLSKNKYGVLSITNDVTERVIYERELLKAMKKAEASEKMKSEFLAQMSHEIRTPINTILSFSSLIKDEVKNKGISEIDDLFPIIENAGKRITRTIGLILNMSEIQTGSYEPIIEKLDIFKDIIDEFVVEYNIKANEKGLKFKIDSETNHTNIKGDRYTINQIFDNLLNNAIKYTEKGTISLKVYYVNKKIIVDISDTGIGISEKYIPNLFKPFTQQEQGYTRRFEGNGLGLALVKHYCELNDIDIDVASEVNKGTTFTLIFNSTIF